MLAKLDVRPQDAVFVDDSQKNIDGAQAVGIAGLLFTDVRTLRADLKSLGIL